MLNFQIKRMLRTQLFRESGKDILEVALIYTKRKLKPKKEKNLSLKE
jgi:hypothetical protein